MNNIIVDSLKQKTQNIISEFRGLNYNHIINNGELSEVNNMCSDNFPCISTRNPRTVISTEQNAEYFRYIDDKLLVIKDNKLYYNGSLIGSLSTSKKFITTFNKYVLIFPDKKYFNPTNNTLTSMGASTPDIDFAIEHENRLWGVKGNNIYASKLGDFNIWNEFQGLATDSYALTINTIGDITGISKYGTQLLIFKENYIYKLYGSKPSNYQLVSLECQGLQTNCEKSICFIDGVLYFKSKNGIMAYNGSYPICISNNFANRQFNEAIIGTDYKKLYVSLNDGTNYYLYVYDLLNNIWYKEDIFQATNFQYYNGSFYGLNKYDYKLYKFNSGNEVINWEFETEEFNIYTSYKKQLINIEIKYRLNNGSYFNIYYKVNDGEYTFLNTINNSNELISYLSVNPTIKTDTLRLKVCGSGNAKIYYIKINYFIGGDK